MDVLLSTMTNLAAPVFEICGHKVVDVVHKTPVPYSSYGRAGVLAINRAIEQAESLGTHRMTGPNVALVGVSKLFACYSEILEAPYSIDDPRSVNRAKTYLVRLTDKPILVTTAIAVILPGGGSKKDYNMHSLELKPFRQSELDFLSSQPEVIQAMGGLAWDVPGSAASKMLIKHVVHESTNLNCIIGLDPSLLNKVL